MRRLMKGKRRKSENPSDAESEENGGNAHNIDGAEQIKPADDDESAPKSKRRTLRGRDSNKLGGDETPGKKDNENQIDNENSELPNHENGDAGKNAEEKRRKKEERKATTSQEEIESEEEYEVERVISHRIVKGRRQFLVRWKGYEENADTWKNENELNCPKLIDDYLTNKDIEDESGDMEKTEKSQNSKDNTETYETDDKSKKTPKNKRTTAITRTRKSTKATKKENNDEKLERNENEEDESEKQIDTGKKAKKIKGGAVKKVHNDESDDEKEFEVEKIIDVYFKKNKSREFLIRWKGYSASDDTWEPEANLNCPELITKFMEKVEKAKTSEIRELRANPSHTKRYTLTMQSPGRRLSRRNAGKERTTYHQCDE